jgi:hypothetical protein
MHAVAFVGAGRTVVTGSSAPADAGGGCVTLRAVPSLQEIYRYAIPEGCAPCCKLRRCD